MKNCPNGFNCVYYHYEKTINYWNNNKKALKLLKKIMPNPMEENYLKNK